MPFSLRNLKHDLEDVGSNFDGAPALEFRLFTDALELELRPRHQRIRPATGSRTATRTRRRKRCTSSCAEADG